MSYFYWIMSLGLAIGLGILVCVYLDRSQGKDR